MKHGVRKINAEKPDKTATAATSSAAAPVPPGPSDQMSAGSTLSVGLAVGVLFTVAAFVNLL